MAQFQVIETPADDPISKFSQGLSGAVQGYIGGHEKRVQQEVERDKLQNAITLANIRGTTQRDVAGIHSQTADKDRSLRAQIAEREAQLQENAQRISEEFNSGRLSLQRDELDQLISYQAASLGLSREELEARIQMAADQNQVSREEMVLRNAYNMGMLDLQGQRLSMDEKNINSIIQDRDRQYALRNIEVAGNLWYKQRQLDMRQQEIDDLRDYRNSSMDMQRYIQEGEWINRLTIAQLEADLEGGKATAAALTKLRQEDREWADDYYTRMNEQYENIPLTKHPRTGQTITNPVQYYAWTTDAGTSERMNLERYIDLTADPRAIKESSNHRNFTLGNMLSKAEKDFLARQANGDPTAAYQYHKDMKAVEKYFIRHQGDFVFSGMKTPEERHWKQWIAYHKSAAANAYHQQASQTLPSSDNIMFGPGIYSPYGYNAPPSAPAGPPAQAPGELNPPAE